MYDGFKIQKKKFVLRIFVIFAEKSHRPYLF